MGCSNCFNGCADIISDKCVKYTGNNFTLGEITIENGDSLLMVEQDILFLINLISTGTGINPNINYAGLCTEISTLLTNGSDSTLNEVLDAIAEVVCTLVTDVGDLRTEVDAMNADYIVDCLAPVLPSAGVHDILQAVIDKACEIEDNLTALTLELHTNYVQISDLDTYIQNYLDSSPTTSLVNSKMTPWVAVPYFGPTSGIFDATGAGIGDWIKVYVCNGANNTPDLRGRVVVGCTNIGTLPFPAQTDPAIAGNPTYTPATPAQGSNLVILSTAQLPSHSHTVTIGQAPLTGTINGISQSFYEDGVCTGVFTKDAGKVVTETPVQQDSNAGGRVSMDATHIHAATCSNIGNNQGHSNIQPCLPAYYIMYIP